MSKKDFLDEVGRPKSAVRRMTLKERWQKRLPGDGTEVREASEPKRVPVSFRYDAVIPGFLKQMAEVGHYAAEKYGSWDQYLASRLEGDKAPINHIYEHLRQYVEGEPYDHFEGDPRRHLVAVAYNAMMEWAYHSLYGAKKHPFTERLARTRRPR